MSTVVFLGPSLPRATALALLPGARILPPVAVGEVVALVRRRPPARLAIIDGYFERMAAVWHKELLFAMERGVEVWGAASMGALRAAELAPFGMRGVGAIYRGFASGELTDDDEVAVRHLPAEHGYRPTSDAMVNLRAGLARARKRGLLTARSESALLALGKARFYADRSWQDLVADGRAAGLPRTQLDALERLGPVDRKGADAALLLRTLARKSSAVKRRPDWRLARTWFWEQLARRQG